MNTTSEHQAFKRRTRAYGRLYRWIYEQPNSRRACVAADALCAAMQGEPAWEGSLAFDAYSAAISEARGDFAAAIAHRLALVERVAQAEDSISKAGPKVRSGLAETVVAILDDNDQRLVALYSRLKRRRTRAESSRVRALRSRLIQIVGRAPRKNRAIGLVRG